MADSYVIYNTDLCTFLFLVNQFEKWKMGNEWKAEIVNWNQRLRLLTFLL